ncbi:hypothetical protein PN441_07450 [Spirulina major CS-329]|uniref:hypothetical protein n=1 Tax=Spirulina TaxID=1154 RepID=UPI00232A7F28|nr:MULTISPECIES: hypothetical protein [Spirulina]MDB9496000.1 hypothetical protein [Spirulina subsalsa CS-330]MDB9502903.1 hypothetical protein [Spirulina major CS-329]
MALSEEEKEKIRDILEEQEEQKRRSILGSLENFARWLRVTASIVVSLAALKPVFISLCGAFL